MAHHYFLSMGLTKTFASNGGLILGMAGVSFIVLKGNRGLSSISPGDVDVFLSILAQAISFILIKKASNTLDPRLMTGYMLIAGSIFLFVLGLFFEPAGMESMAGGSAGLWTVFFASAIVATALGHMLYNDAIGKVGAAETAIFINLSPFFSLVGAAIFLGEKIVIEQILGFFFILCGVVLGSGAFDELRIKLKQKQEINIPK